jgi:hypothetical protein
MKTLFLPLLPFKTVHDATVVEKALRLLRESAQMQDSIRKMKEVIEIQYLGHVPEFAQNKFTLLHKHQLEFSSVKIAVEALHTFFGGDLRRDFVIDSVISPEWILKHNTAGVNIGKRSKYQFKGNAARFEEDVTTIVLLLSEVTV